MPAGPVVSVPYTTQEDMLDLIPNLQNLRRDESGAIGWLVVGIIVGIGLVIWLIAKIIGGIF